MEIVLAERAAERRQSSPALLSSTAAGVSAAKGGGSDARSPRWGADGRRIPPGREFSQVGCACAKCRRSCSACSSGGKKGQDTNAAGERVMRPKRRDGKTATVVSRTHWPEGGGAASAPSAASEIPSSLGVPVAAVEAKPEGHQEADNAATSNPARLSATFDGYDHGQGETKPDGTRRKHKIRPRQSTRRRGSTAVENHSRDGCFACGMEASPLPPEEKQLDQRGRDRRREGRERRATDGQEARCYLERQVLNENHFTGKYTTTASAA